MKGILNKVKDYILGIFFGIAGILGIIAYFFFSKKENIDYNEEKNKAKGRNEIIKKNIDIEKEKIKNINEDIQSVEENIEDIKNSKNNESLDKFFDKRGFWC